MLSQNARAEIVKRIQESVGHPVSTEVLSPPTAQAIDGLAKVQRHVYVMKELLRGEQRRVDDNALLRLASRMGRDSEKKEREALRVEIDRIQSEIDAKVPVLAKQVEAEDSARKAGLPPPDYKGTVGVVQLKCPNCGASLPMPTGRFLKCEYCGTVLTVEEVGSQMRALVKGF